jgi:hypothetical protein
MAKLLTNSLNLITDISKENKSIKIIQNCINNHLLMEHQLPSIKLREDPATQITVWVLAPLGKPVA